LPPCEFNIANAMDKPIPYKQVKLNWKNLRLAVAVTVLASCAGCGGFSGSKSFSPLSFFLPGIAKTDPQPAPAETVPVPVPEPEPKKLAQAE